MKPIVTITEYKPAFKDAVVELILSIQQNEFNVPVSIETQPDLLNIPLYYQHGKGNFWVALVDEHIAGTIALFDIGNDRGALRKMFVYANYRGKEWGVGQKLLYTLFEWAKAKGYREVLLGTTEKFLAAQRFYEKNGFKEINIKDLPGEFPIMKVDVKFYKHVFPFYTADG